MGSDNRRRLCGAKLAVYNECGEKVCEGFTNERGELCFGNLPLGEYTIRELCAPAGYCPTSEVFCVKITCDDYNKCLTIVNRAIRGSIKIIKLGDC